MPEWWRREKLQISGRRQEIGIEGVGIMPVRSGESEPVVSQLRPRAEEDEIINGVRLIARDRRAGGLEAGDDFSIPRADNLCNQVTTIYIGAFQRRKSSIGGDP